MSSPSSNHPICSVESLRELEDLKLVPEDQLQWLVDHSECTNLKEGDYLFHPGEDAQHLRVGLTGKLHIWSTQNGSKLSFSHNEAPYITGKLPYSRLQKSLGYGESMGDSVVLELHEKFFPQMIKEHYELTEALVHFMTNRVRTFTSQRLQNEKLMSLGKLSAGLSHELNNPASAVVRSAQALKKHLQALPASFKAVTAIKMSPEEVDTVNELLFKKLEESKHAPDLTLMQSNEREDALAAFLEDQGVDDGYEMAENLVNFSWTEEDLSFVLNKTSKDHFLAVMYWINNNLVTEAMVGEIEEASARIKDLVSSVKGYTHMDQGLDRQAVDIHTGLKRTVTIMNHKIKKLGIEVARDLDPNLPEIMAFPGEINQVFTNLIDNAIDAMAEQERKVLTIQTEVLGDQVRVKIGDTGTGIPEEIRGNIFDPFFTTKRIGEGTGMGLDIVQKIIRHHKGKIEVDSGEKGTVFTILLPQK